jgi:hypothetical protein
VMQGSPATMIFQKLVQDLDPEGLFWMI